MSTLDPVKLIHDAAMVANKAGDEWIQRAHVTYIVKDAFTGRKTGEMLDLCGNAHVVMTDKRSKIYKAFKQAGVLSEGGKSTINIDHKYTNRQEHGLRLACADAARKFLITQGITNVEVWEYID